MIFAKKKKKLLYSWPKAELRSCFPEGMKGILPVTRNRQNKCVRLVSIGILFSTCFHCAFRRMHIFLSFPLTVEFVEFLLALFRKIINLPPLPPPTHLCLQHRSGNELVNVPLLPQLFKAKPPRLVKALPAPTQLWKDECYCAQHQQVLRVGRLRFNYCVESRVTTKATFTCPPWTSLEMAVNRRLELR